MKKKIKKLALSKDTVLWLAEAKPVVGGGDLTPMSCNGTCGFDTCRVDVCWA